jgi:hypothetical protein
VIEWFTAPGSAPFTVALLVMLGLTAIELASLLTGVSVSDAVDELVVTHVDVQTVGDAPTGMEVTSPDGPSMVGRFLAWLYVGTVPVLMVFIVFLTIFGLIGLFAQHLLRSMLGAALPAIVAAPIVAVLCLPVVRACTGGLARVLPRDETSAVDAATFVGRTAVITGGAARVGLPAQARLTDQFGTTHYVLVEPEDAEDTFPTGSLVLLLRQTGGGRFSAIANPNAALVDREHA